MDHINDLLHPAVRQATGRPGLALIRSPRREEEQAARPQQKTSSPEGVCPTCKGTGYTRQNVPFGHPNFGKALECKCHQDQRKEREQQQWVDRSEIETLERFGSATFESYDLTKPGVRDAYQQSFRFSAYPQGWLVLAGPNGCGKTHLAVAVAKERLNHGMGVFFQTVPDLLDLLRSTFNPFEDTPFTTMFEQLRTTELLILDDLGAEQGTHWANEKLYQLLNYRYNAMLPTMITTNCLYLRGIEERIASRLRDRGLVKMVTMDQAKDYRPMNTLTVIDADDE